MIVTIYGKDGTKQRKALGYKGGSCQQATAPYEAREVRGQMKKSPTGEMYESPGDPEAVTTQQKLGR